MSCNHHEISRCAIALLPHDVTVLCDWPGKSKQIQTSRRVFMSRDMSERYKMSTSTVVSSSNNQCDAEGHSLRTKLSRRSLKSCGVTDPSVRVYVPWARATVGE